MCFIFPRVTCCLKRKLLFKLNAWLAYHHLPSLLQSTFPIFDGMFTRALFRLVLFFLLFGAFFFTFLPSTTQPSRLLMGKPNFPTHRRPAPMRPPTFAPPQSGSHRHRIKAT